ncbi:Carbamoyltransferase HypF [Baekduia alba]|uniref:carbamoyltransferase HypF n=1 Tax=Baekduia alba TaxID=2997333 RepID=UPI002341B7AF|nr:carbamoyltransferase HypF [Baekduia alba]WCB95113.1 Carbamoyltransferase HypF [Baekduia alba]
MSAAPASTGRRRVRGHVEGTVQGVGFRPYVHRLARELGLTGTVGNDAHGVVLEVEGEGRAVAAFLRRLPVEAPPLAHVDGVRVHDVAPIDQDSFAIVESARGGAPDALVVPDAATCDACLAELRDPADRRHRHAFISCTHCGPRFTIVRGVPYDRPLTTMAGFPMCAACRAEYEDPADRRFHAQPIACPDCGPRLALLGADVGDAVDAAAAAAALLRAGAIVAVKGIGGYHLACRADDERAVAALRARKHREDKPFALMAADVAGARALVVLDEDEERLLRGPARPIVLAARRAGAPAAPAVAPHRRELGVMLPYAPLHHLLLADAGGPLVLTSGNVSDEPIAYRDADARERLAPIADAFLAHDRPIHMRTDDGVVRVAVGRPRVLRRSRGHVPSHLPLPGGDEAPPLLACGAELKSTFCVARDGRAWVSHHLGDLQDAATRASFVDGVAHFERLFAVAPELVVHDLHPGYASTAYALEREGVATLGVQHHHAHLAACLAEHGLDGPAVGAIYDGSGYGADATVWGGELLVGDARDFTRAGHLLAVPLPGGDRAVAEPWRMACAWLAAVEDDVEVPALPAALARHVTPRRWADVARLARSGLAAPPTTSAGRLLDAVAALCGVRATVSYEGQAAIELEAVADRAQRRAYPLEVGDDLVLDARPTIRAVRDDLAAGAAVPVVSARTHNALAVATAEACARAAGRAGTDMVVLSGGVFQNRLLLEGCHADLTRRGLRVLHPERLPCNDGGIAFGQAAVAAVGRAG